MRTRRKLPEEPTSDLNWAAFKILLEPMRQHKYRVLAAFLTLALTAFVVLAAGWAIRNFIDEGFITGNRKKLDLSLLVLTGTTIFIALCSYARSYLVSWLGEVMIGSLRRRVFEHLLYVDLDYFENHRSGEITARLTTDTNLMQIVVGGSFSIAVRNFFLMIGGMIMMGTTSLKLSLYTLLLIPLIIIPIMTLGGRVRHHSKENQRLLSRLSGFLEETFHHIHTIHAFTREKDERQMYYKMSRENFQTTVRRILARSALVCLVMLIAFCGVSFVLWCGGLDVISGEMTAGNLSAFIFYAVLTAASAGSFSELYSDMQRAAGAAERLLALLKLPKRKDGTRPLSLPWRGIVAMHNVTFAYPSHPKQAILKNFTLSIAPGEKVAIVGLSGAGKSTIFSLLMGFYTPQAGSIYIEGSDLSQLLLDDVRHYFSLVTQDAPIFSTTLYDNIVFGNTEATKEQVQYAIDHARLRDVIEKLPKGLNTLVGTKGAKLSSGQKQRIAIARAILRQPCVLLLDEATNALDAENETMIQDSLNHIMHNRTTIIIAHSLLTTMKCDRIIVMNDGEIEAVGTHGELMTQDGLYKRLAQMQLVKKPLSVIAG